MEQYPDTCAVLVRRHGVYVWGGKQDRIWTGLVALNLIEWPSTFVSKTY